ncbi:MAG: hypothetical protein N4A49_14710 [Marinifilaceae bacterium]|jgi:hypothetical protein|nr:hypothetical protein [Marinifilaceae bacterium]
MKYSLIIIFAIFSNISYAQESQDVKKIKNLIQDVDNLNISDESRIQYADSISLYLNNILKTPNSFEYNFMGLNRVKIISSSDQKIRLFSWGFKLSDGKWRYYCIIQKRNKNNITVHNLIHSKTLLKRESVYTAKSWYGALYYNIIPYAKKYPNRYFLVGWDGNIDNYQRKILEVIDFDQDNNITIGVKSIKSNNRYLKRIIFNYSTKTVMNINYKKNKFIFDHLAPSQPKYKGYYEFYGPDFSYDSLEKHKNEWEIKQNINPVK